MSSEQAIPTLSFGQKAVGYNSHPTEKQIDLMNRIRAKYAELIDLLQGERVDPKSAGDIARYYSKAISELEDSSFNAIKAATWSY